MYKISGERKKEAGGLCGEWREPASVRAHARDGHGGETLQDPGGQNRHPCGERTGRGKASQP